MSEYVIGWLEMPLGYPCISPWAHKSIPFHHTTITLGPHAYHYLIASVTRTVIPKAGTTSTPTGKDHNYLLASSNRMSEEEEGRLSPNEVIRRRRARTQAVEEKQRATTKSMLADRVRAEKEERLRKARYVYRDYSRIRASPESIFVHQQQMQQQRDCASIRTQKLPAKLNAMLSTSDYQHIISWVPHGRAWKVHNSPMFVEHVMPQIFEYNNYNSFIRLINAWGFRRMTKGPDRNAYWHEVSSQYYGM
jgi:hypothetical protein